MEAGAPNVAPFGGTGFSSPVFFLGYTPVNQDSWLENPPNFEF